MRMSAWRRSRGALERMRQVGAIVLPALMAAVAPTVATTAYFIALGAISPDLWGISLIALVVAVGHVVFLGLPGFVWLYKLNCARWWSITMLGFVAGSLPIGVLTWPLRSGHAGSSTQLNGVWTMIDGIPTAAGWSQYGAGIAFYGALGALGAASFWLTRERMRSNNSLERSRDR